MASFDKKSNRKRERIEMYTTKMKEISFMAEYVCDIPEIFDTKTIKCKLFLIKIFTTLHPNFHYLSFLSENDIDQELGKIASVLQVYPQDPSQKSTALLQNLNEANTHIFWIRLFNLCKIHNTNIDSKYASKEIGSDKIFSNRFSSITETLQHMNYNITTLKSISEDDINQEINTWIKEAPPNYEEIEIATADIVLSEVEEKNLPEINNLINTVKYIEKKIDHQNQHFPEKTCYFYKDFFVNFIQTVKNVTLFKNNLNVISSLFVPNIINRKTLYSGLNWLLYKYQIKRCNDIIESISLKSKNCNSNTFNTNF